MSSLRLRENGRKIFLEEEADLNSDGKVCKGRVCKWRGGMEK